MFGQLFEDLLRVGLQTAELHNDGGEVEIVGEFGVDGEEIVHQLLVLLQLLLDFADILLDSLEGAEKLLRKNDHVLIGVVGSVVTAILALHIRHLVERGRERE